MGKILQVNHIEKCFGDFTAVKDISLSIEEGGMFSLLGHNGAGKSTLIKIILGLVNQTSGEVVIDGLRYGQKSKDIKRLIGYLPERMNFYANLTAWETITFYAKLKGVSPERCEEVLHQVGLGEVMHRRVGAFSKGMQQRLGMAQAIIHRPKLLVLDEPTTGLDPVGILEFKQMIRKWNQEGATIFFSSHNLSDVQELAGSMAIMNKGRIVAEGTLAQLQNEFQLKTRLKVSLKPVQLEDFYTKPAFMDGKWRFEVQDEALVFYCELQEKMAILQILTDNGYEVNDFSIEEPGLDEIYLKVMNL